MEKAPGEKIVEEATGDFSSLPPSLKKRRGGGQSDIASSPPSTNYSFCALGEEKRGGGERAWNREMDAPVYH